VVAIDERVLCREDVVESSSNSRLLRDNGRVALGSGFHPREPSDGNLTRQMGRHTVLLQMIEIWVNNQVYL
jgi:hypothetical protein